MARQKGSKNKVKTEKEVEARRTEYMEILRENTLLKELLIKEWNK